MSTFPPPSAKHYVAQPATVFRIEAALLLVNEIEKRVVAAMRLRNEATTAEIVRRKVSDVVAVYAAMSQPS